MRLRWAFMDTHQLPTPNSEHVDLEVLPPDLAEWTHVVVSELPTASDSDLLDALCQLTDWRRVSRFESAITKLIEGLR